MIAHSTRQRPLTLPKGPSSPRRDLIVQSATELRLTGSNPGTLRANPFPEVTDLFCRLPLPTLFYRLEAVNLGDLMRL